MDLLEPLRDGIGTRAVLGVVLLGLACGPLGVWVLLYRESYAAESISHGMLPGLVVAALAGIPLVLGAVAGVALAALAMAAVARDDRLGPDTAVAVVVTSLLGLGGLLATSPDVPPRLSELLFGDLLGLSDADLVTAGALCAGIVLALALTGRRLAVAAFDPPSARALGVGADASRLVLLGVLALTTVAAVQALGGLLLVALVLGPAAAARRLARRLPSMLVLAAGLAVLAGIAGVEASYHLDVAAGGATALAAVGTFGLSLLARDAR